MVELDTAENAAAGEPPSTASPDVLFKNKVWLALDKSLCQTAQLPVPFLDFPIIISGVVLRPCPTVSVLVLFCPETLTIENPVASLALTVEFIEPVVLVTGSPSPASYPHAM